MTRIGDGQGAGAGQRGPFSSRDDLLGANQWGHGRSGSSRSSEARGRVDKTNAGVLGADDRATDFQRTMHAAAKASGQDLDRSADAGAGDGRLLAFVPPNPGTPQDAPGRAEAQQAPPAADRLASTILARVEQVLRAEWLVAAAGPSSVTVDLGASVEGLSAVTVTMTDTVLEVVLLRNAADPSDEFVGAAQLLAERLSHRFGTRSVRVLDGSRDAAAGDAEAESAGGLNEISRILGGRSSTS